eukprot:gnl/TRDRNA2_/TRDRNA2_62157_c0_seq1.p1 gnl/TRDRNA2_/TRDRNA2_62157_c0~~gnl/TRDRNA2_/TRDRNA2_62157_c0_seq1.p1  ORF type:complete len:161 (-),score=27.58 gnl/TRDRNA2_/TRDRNA2_62157_c0_seq1:201-683(-)
MSLRLFFALCLGIVHGGMSRSSPAQAVETSKNSSFAAKLLRGPGWAANLKLSKGPEMAANTSNSSAASLKLVDGPEKAGEAPRENTSAATGPEYTEGSEKAIVAPRKNATSLHAEPRMMVVVPGRVAAKSKSVMSHDLSYDTAGYSDDWQGEYQNGDDGR